MYTYSVILQQIVVNFISLLSLCFKHFVISRFAKRVVDSEIGDAKDTRWSPLYHTKDDVKKVPPALFILAEVDPCKDDGKGIRILK